MEPIHLPGGLVNGLLLCGVESEESVGEALGGTDNGIELGGTDEFVVAVVFDETLLILITSQHFSDARHYLLA